MKWCYVQINECDLQATTYPTIYFHCRLHNDNENKSPSFPECICNKWQNMMQQISQAHNHVQHPREQGEWLRQNPSVAHCIIRPTPLGAGRTTPSQPGHYPLSRAALLTRPCPHCSHSRAPGEQWARLCVFTLQGCVQAARLCRGSPVIHVVDIENEGVSLHVLRCIEQDKSYKQNIVTKKVAKLICLWYFG